MNRLYACLRDERGVALVMALIMLVALTGLALAFLSVSAFEPQISQNLASTAQARMVADAGLEWAFNQLVTVPPGVTQDVYWNNLLVAAAAGGTLTGGAIPIPGMPAALGSFTARIRNDITAGDTQLTGLALDASGSPVIDQNGRLIVTSTATVNGGSVGTVSKTIAAVVRRVVIPPINGALSFPGTQADVNFSGSTFDIQGVDRNMDGSAGSCSTIYGITTSGDPAYAANEGTVENALLGNQNNQVIGRSEVDGSVTQGANTIQADNALTSEMVTDFVNQLKVDADLKFTTGPGNTLDISNIGNSCPSSWQHSNCWGTPSQPKVVYVKGDPSADYLSLSISGNSTGSGILIVENGRVDLTGDFRWNGPVIVTGNNVGIRYWGGGNQEVYGAVIVNELNDTGQNLLEGDVRGNAKMYYSCQALSLIQNRLGRRYMSIYSWREQ